MYQHFSLLSNVPASLLPTLVRGLRDADNTTRLYAAVAIGKVDGDAANKTMKGLLQHEDAAVRVQAIRWIQRHPELDVTSLLAKHFNDPDDAVRLTAMSVLRALAPEQSVNTMLKALEHSDAAVRNQATLYFVNAPDARANTRLIASLRDMDNQVRASAARAVDKINRADARTALATYRKLESQPLDTATLFFKAETAVDLKKLLSHRHSAVRRRAAVTLRGLRGVAGERATRIAIAEMNHPDANVRLQLVARLADAPAEAATDALSKRLDDPSSAVRLWAAKALSLTLGERARKVCVDALDNPDPAVRVHALYRFHLYPNDSEDRLLPKVIAALDDSQADVRLNAARTLWKLPGESAAQAALAAFTHPDPAVRKHVVLRFFRSAGRNESSSSAEVPGRSRHARSLTRSQGDPYHARRRSDPSFDYRLATSRLSGSRAGHSPFHRTPQFEGQQCAGENAERSHSRRTTNNDVGTGAFGRRPGRQISLRND